MGNSIGKIGQVPAHIGIRVTSGINGTVSPGDKVTGVMYLSVHRDNVEAGALVLCVVGREHTCVEYQQSHTRHANGKTETYTTREHDRKSIEFLNASYVVTNFNGSANTGNYEFPFEFTLPMGLPGSVFIQRGGQYGTVEYTIAANLERPGSSFMAWTIRGSSPLQVVLKDNGIQRYPIYIPPTLTPISTCLCSSKGDFVSGVHAESNMLSAGESMEVCVGAINMSKSKFIRIQMEIVQVVNLRAKSHSEVLHYSLGKQTIPAEGLGLEKVGIIDATEQMKTIKRILDNGDHKFRLNLTQQDVYNTMDGSLFSVQHTFKVTFITSMFTTNPVLKSPFVIFSGSTMQCSTPTNSPGPPQPTLPADWKAEQAAVVTMPEIGYMQSKEISDTESPQPGYASNGFVNSPRFVGIPEVPSAPALGPFDALQNKLTNSFDQTGEVRKWCQTNDPSTLSGEEMTSLFTGIRFAVDQIAVAQALSGAMKQLQVTCAQLCGASRGSQGYNKRDVVENLIGKNRVADPQNKAMVEAGFSSFEFFFLEHHFQ